MLVPLPRNQEDHGFWPARPLCLLCGVVTLLVLGVSLAAAELDRTQGSLREKVEQQRLFKNLKIGDASVASSIVLPDFYERREFELAWVKHTSIEDLFRAIRESEADGLDPRDYHLAALERLRRTLEASSTPTLWQSG